MSGFIDWEIEAKRIGKAFGIEGEFFGFDNRRRGLFVSTERTSANFWLASDLLLQIRYDKSEMDFRISQVAKGKHLTTQVCIMWSGETYLGVRNNWPRIGQVPVKANLTLAKGLFYLDLLTPEVEDLLQLSLSEHEKLEWMLEYED